MYVLYPISEKQPEQQQEEIKLHLISQLMEQIRFIHGNKAVNGETFDYLYDMGIWQLQGKLKEYEIKIAEKANPKIREAKKTDKQIRAYRGLLISCIQTGDDVMVKTLTKECNRLIKHYKQLLGKQEYP